MRGYINQDMNQARQNSTEDSPEQNQDQEKDLEPNLDQEEGLEQIQDQEENLEKSQNQEEGQEVGEGPDRYQKRKLQNIFLVIQQDMGGQSPDLCQKRQVKVPKTE